MWKEEGRKKAVGIGMLDSGISLEAANGIYQILVRPFVNMLVVYLETITQLHHNIVCDFKFAPQARTRKRRGPNGSEVVAADLVSVVR